MATLQEIAPQAPQVANGRTKAISWTKLSDQERNIFLGLMMGANDKQSIAIAGVHPATFYRYKKKLVLMIDQMGEEIENKARQVLKGSVIEASQTLVKGLKQPSYRYQLESAKEILDRVMGKALQRTELKSREAVTVLNINATPQELEALKTPLSPLDSRDQTVRETNVTNVPTKPDITGDVVELHKI